MCIHELKTVYLKKSTNLLKVEKLEYSIKIQNYIIVMNKTFKFKGNDTIHHTKDFVTYITVPYSDTF